MSHFRKPMVMEINGFSHDGVFVGSATYAGMDGWRLVTKGDDGVKSRGTVRHEHEARQALRDAGAINLKESDGRKY